MKSPQKGELILHKLSGCIAIFDSLALDEYDSGYVEYFAIVPTTEFGLTGVFWNKDDCVCLGMDKSKIINRLQK